MSLRARSHSGSSSSRSSLLANPNQLCFGVTATAFARATDASFQCRNAHPNHWCVAVRLTSRFQRARFTRYALLLKLWNAWCRARLLELVPPIHAAVRDKVAVPLGFASSVPVREHLEHIKTSVDLLERTKTSVDLRADTPASLDVALSLVDLFLLAVAMGFDFDIIGLGRNAATRINLMSTLLPAARSVPSENALAVRPDEVLHGVIAAQTCRPDVTRDLAKQMCNRWSAQQAWSALAGAFGRSLVPCQTYRTTEERPTHELFSQIVAKNEDLSRLFDLEAVKADVEMCAKRMRCQSYDSGFFDGFRTKGESARRDAAMDLIAAVSQVVRKHHGFYPRSHQLFVAWAFYHARLGATKSVIFQVGTGEGKSIIVLLLAAVELLCFAQKVDVVTSQTLLAIREAEENRVLFDSIGSGVTHVERQQGDGETQAEWYKTYDVVFGTMHGFEVGMLGVSDAEDLDTSRSYAEQNDRAVSGRSFDLAIVDECDSSQIDCTQGRTLLSGATPGFHPVERLFHMIYTLVASQIGRAGLPLKVKGEVYLANPDWSFVKHLAASMCSGFAAGGAHGVKHLAPASPADVQSDNGAAKRVVVDCVVLKCMQCMATVAGFTDHFNLRGVSTEDNLRQRVAAMPVDQFVELLCHESVFNLTVALFADVAAKDGPATQVQLVSFFCGSLVLPSIPDGQDLKEIDFVLLQIGDRLAVAAGGEDANKQLLESVSCMLRTEMSNPSSQLGSAVPDFERDMFVESAQLYSENAWLAMTEYKEDREYTVKDGKIMSIDKATGVTQMNMTYSNGLQQFLEIKHGLPLSNLGVSGQTVTNLSFLKRYARLAGLTGTAGGDACRCYYAANFGADVVVVPPYAEKPLREFEDVICHGMNDWIDTIVADCEMKVRLGRVVLIICEDIHTAMLIMKRIKEQVCQSDIVPFFQSTDFKQVAALSRKHPPGTVIVATNMGGRGTDLKMTDKALRNGGLHVSITLMPENERIEAQNVGRCSRQGQPGSKVLILDKSAPMGSENAALMRAMRDKIVELSMQALGQRVTEGGDKSEFYDRYMAFVQELRLQHSDTVVNEHVLSQVHYAWSVAFHRIQQVSNGESGGRDAARCKRERIYDRFRDRVRSGLGSGAPRELCFNPFSHTIQAYQKGLSYEERMRIADRCISRMDSFKFIPAYIKVLYSDGADASWDDKRSRAMSALRDTASLLETHAEHRRQMHIELVEHSKLNAGTEGAMSRTDAAYEKVFVMEHNIMDCLRKAVLEKTKKFRTSFEPWSRALKMRKDEIRASKVLQYYMLCGLFGTVLIEKKTSLFDRVLGVLVSMLGVALLIGGFLASTAIPVVGWFIGPAIMGLGAAAVFKGIAGAVTGQFDLGEFVSQDVLNMLKYIGSFGLSDGVKRFLQNMIKMIPGIQKVAMLVEKCMAAFASPKRSRQAFEKGDVIGGLLQLSQGTVEYIAGDALPKGAAQVLEAALKTAGGIKFAAHIAKKQFRDALMCVEPLLPESIRGNCSAVVQHALEAVGLVTAASNSASAFLSAAVDTMRKFNVSVSTSLVDKVLRVFDVVERPSLESCFTAILSMCGETGSAAWMRVQGCVLAPELGQLAKEFDACARQRNWRGLVNAAVKTILRSDSMTVAKDKLNEAANIVYASAQLVSRIGKSVTGTLMGAMELLMTLFDLSGLPPALRSAINGTARFISAARGGSAQAALMAVADWVHEGLTGVTLTSDLVKTEALDFVESARRSLTGMLPPDMAAMSIPMIGAGGRLEGSTSLSDVTASLSRTASALVSALLDDHPELRATGASPLDMCQALGDSLLDRAKGVSRKGICCPLSKMAAAVDGVAPKLKGIGDLVSDVTSMLDDPEKAERWAFNEFSKSERARAVLRTAMEAKKTRPYRDVLRNMFGEFEEGVQSVLKARLECTVLSLTAKRQLVCALEIVGGVGALDCFVFREAADEERLKAGVARLLAEVKDPAEDKLLDLASDVPTVERQMRARVLATLQQLHKEVDACTDWAFLNEANWKVSLILDAVSVLPSDAFKTLAVGEKWRVIVEHLCKESAETEPQIIERAMDDFSKFIGGFQTQAVYRGLCKPLGALFESG